ncbi:hypothetical protein U4E84_11800 [Halorubrum sp. AD140]|uniref:hypothetical protein n=1 Tax=Halorubrum sp. AD140 TaxID=3050073 RepID=UPI002ACC55C7|nr:hypothetical protein [Halorubrum sp. AD140]MDZ5812025.1 hypothetical protein [Halorubrum sp. AD140]
MERRKFIIGAGALATGSAAAVGTGAMSSVSAERSVSVETESDADGANLGLEPNDDYEGAEDEYAQVTDGKLELTFDDVNKNAVTKYEELITVTNNGTQSCRVFVNNDFGDPDEDPIWGSGKWGDGPMDILNGSNYTPEKTSNNNDSIVGGNANQTPGGSVALGSGESVDLTVVIDTREYGDVDIDGEILIKAV